jgi:hypothetical protein
VRISGLALAVAGVGSSAIWATPDPLRVVTFGVVILAAHRVARRAAA